LTFNFFKDSAILNQFVQNQLKARQFDLGEIRERVKNDLTKSIQEKEAEKSSSGAKT
jgi:hypothetical protein